MRGEVPAARRSGHALSRCNEHETERDEIAILRVRRDGHFIIVINLGIFSGKAGIQSVVYLFYIVTLG